MSSTTGQVVNETKPGVLSSFHPHKPRASPLADPLQISASVALRAAGTWTPEHLPQCPSILPPAAVALQVSSFTINSGDSTIKHDREALEVRDSGQHSETLCSLTKTIFQRPHRF
ncbi:hypothetical protein E2C01_068480 [Portunus trituberculatus]|uniref:Uncharacterized protein n=1 Tax=Portunus trituberculatus TaxID=210409 RepID=A0A5B7HS37_PORTR|nr:hypothetical protein [Portunus trituberculatus]